MFDTHYDLLTIAYKAYLTNDYSYLEEIAKYFNSDNIVGVIANLYFMSKEEMENEICTGYYKDDVSVLDMFIKSKEILDKYLPKTEIIYSIEGADYIKDTVELEKLYSAGLRALILCWNTESKYASGNRSDKGLTDEGRELISKAIDLGIGIDLSHANKKSFYDLCDLIEEKKNSGVDVCVYASHSNTAYLCNNSRNLDDEQLKRIKDLGGLVGAVGYSYFVVDEPNNYSSEYLKKYYIEHIKYIENIVGEKNIMISSDDMKFCSWYDNKFSKTSVYDYKSIKKDLYSDLEKEFSLEEVNNIIYNNVKNRIYNKLINK